MEIFEVPVGFPMGKAILQIDTMISSAYLSSRPFRKGFKLLKM
jgi:hypothetical protein